MMSINLSDTAIINIHGADYYCIISGISKSQIINLMHNISLTEEKENIIKHKHIFSHIKISKKVNVWRY